MRGGRILIVDVSFLRKKYRTDAEVIIEKYYTTDKLQMLDELIDYFSFVYGKTRYLGLTKIERQALFVQEKGICFWCRKDILFGQFTVEHLVSLFDEGSLEWNNLRIACELCNNKRDHTFIDQRGYYINWKRRIKNQIGIFFRKYKILAMLTIDLKKNVLKYMRETSRS